MAIDLQEMTNGDTNYVAKFNANFTTIEAAINALQQQIVGTAGASTLALSALLSGLFGGATALIGKDSYKPSPSGSNLTVAKGTAFKITTATVVQSVAPVILTLAGQPSGTYYVVPDSSGIPTYQNSSSVDAVYSFFWTGASINSITKLVPALFDVNEEDDSRTSSNTSPETTFDSLDDRLEAIEAVTESVKYRKIGLSLASINTGVAGAIQIDFDGEIVGWSVIADTVGDLVIDVSFSVGSPSGPPPTAPAIPDPDADKISALAPITLSGAQSAAGGSLEVATWDTDLVQWGTVQFRVVSSATIQKATLYIRVKQS